MPDGAVTIFSAHGVSETVESEAQRRKLPVIDATCPLVAKVHIEARRYERDGREIILIGHDGHPEVEGTSGRVKNGVHIVATPQDVARLQVANPEKVAYVTQTTLSVDDTRDVIEALTSRFPSISGPDVKDICYATQNRQASVRKLAEEVELILVAGARISSNSNRLREIGEEMGVPTHLIDDARDLNPGMVRRSPSCRRDRRRLCARGAGAGSGGPPARDQHGRASDPGRDQGAGALQAAGRTGRGERQRRAAGARRRRARRVSAGAPGTNPVSTPPCRSR